MLAQFAQAQSDTDTLPNVFLGNWKLSCILSAEMSMFCYEFGLISLKNIKRSVQKILHYRSVFFPYIC